MLPSTEAYFAEGAEERQTADAAVAERRALLLDQRVHGAHQQTGDAWVGEVLGRGQELLDDGDARIVSMWYEKHETMLESFTLGLRGIE